MALHENAPAIDVVWNAEDLVGECPVWDEASQVLWWTDIEGRLLHCHSPGTGEHRSLETEGRVGSFALAADGNLIVAMEHAFGWVDASDGRTQIIAEPEATLPDNRFNDGCCDLAGRFLAGSMNLPKNNASASLWRLGPDLDPASIAAGVTVSNGLAFSPDGKRMWWADSPTERIFVFDYDPLEGAARNQRLWLDRTHAPGRPDGATVDADGCYWSARWRGSCIARFTPAGKLDRIIELPVSQVTMCTFGGKDHDTLFVTTARNHLSAQERLDEPLAGAVFAIRSGVCGLPARRFSGALRAHPAHPSADTAGPRSMRSEARST